jgi:hypothetical protein
VPSPKSLAGLQAQRLPVELALLAAGALWLGAPFAARVRGGPAAAVAVALGMELVLLVPTTLLELAKDATAETPDRFAASVSSALPPGAELRFAPSVRDSGFLYYLGRRVPATGADDLARELEQPDTAVYWIARRERDVPAGPGVTVTALARGVGSDGRLLLLRSGRNE